MNKLLNKIKQRKKYGLLGNNISHSVSPAVHRSIMNQCNISGMYNLFDTSKEDFADRLSYMNTILDGYNVTIPYKEDVFLALNKKSNQANMFGAVNTVYKNKGYNTDIDGFESIGIDFSDKRVLLLGSGGVARVMAYSALSKDPKELYICARNLTRAQNLASNLNEKFPNKKVICSQEPDMSLVYDVILNATPLGMWPHCDEMPVKKDIIAKAEYVFDSIYNPLSTKMILFAKSKGIKCDGGLKMLVEQALAAQKIWNPNADFENFKIQKTFKILKRKIFGEYPIKIVLTGFMASGKSTIGKKLSRELNIKFLDIDLKIVEKSKMTIPQIFKNKGEAYFRELESLCLSEAMKQNESLIISTGGGALMSGKNAKTVKENNGFIVYLEVDMDTILQRIGDKKTRPLLQGKAVEEINELYKSRLPKYEKVSDFKQDATKSPKEIINDLSNAFGIFKN